MRLGEFYELQLRYAMSDMEAKETLGFKPGENPTPDAVNRAYKKRAFENHPDRGGDPTMMVKVNVARDILLGKQKADRPRTTSPSYTSRPTYRTETKPPPEPIKVSFDEAARSASVPLTGVEWKFKTDSGYGRVSNGTRSGFVAYGVTSDQHVFVAVEHYADRGNMFTPLDIDKYEMWVKKVPIGQDLANVAPKVIRDLWGHFDRGIKKYNAKVQVFDKKMTFADVNRHYGGRSVSFKNAMGLLGEKTPDAWKGKITVVLELGEEVNIPTNKYAYKPCRPHLVINGKVFKLSDQSAALADKINLYQLMWGKKGYWYCGSSKKDITKMRDKKKWLGFWRDICKKANEPKELIDALEAAMGGEKR